ncbi:MAG: LysM peptidoglycan-binding domain-containing protein [Anaerolineales bacterium]|nr:LysM peptidoglycan-binding domain-containing protein [Anaerolineales bacterium]
MRKILCLCAALLSACASSNEPVLIGALRPYATATPQSTATPNVLTVLETPLPTATPHAYTIQSGDTLSELAETFHISQNDLQAANPQINPNSMTIGQTLIIPGPNAPAATTPPAPVPITQTVCHPSADSGLWCFALIHNNTPDVLENVSAQITLFDVNGVNAASQVGFPPLDQIPPNASLPVFVFFPNTPAELLPQAQLLSAVQTSANPAIHATITQSQAEVHGRAAQLSGEIFLPAEAPAAAEVWVAAVAYDTNGLVVGLRRWAGSDLQPGGNLHFQFAVASLGGDIAAVEFFIQTKN